MQKKGDVEAPTVGSKKANVGANQAGALRADKAKLKFEDMNTLFQKPTAPESMRAALEL